MYFLWRIRARLIVNKALNKCCINKVWYSEESSLNNKFNICYDLTTLYICLTPELL